MNKPFVLWGGVDINPELYGEERGTYTQTPNVKRDTLEFWQTRQHIREGNPIIGICRGAQLLCVLNGGKLYQHSEPTIQSHAIVVNDGTIFPNVIAGHHQIMQPKGNFVLLGWNEELVRVWKNNTDSELIRNTAEVVWWPETKCLAIQPHPEWAKHKDPFVIWLNETMKNLGINYEF